VAAPRGRVPEVRAGHPWRSARAGARSLMDPAGSLAADQGQLGCRRGVCGTHSTGYACLGSDALRHASPADPGGSSGIARCFPRADSRIGRTCASMSGRPRPPVVNRVRNMCLRRFSLGALLVTVAAALPAPACAQPIPGALAAMGVALYVFPVVAGLLIAGKGKRLWFAGASARRVRRLTSRTAERRVWRQDVLCSVPMRDQLLRPALVKPHEAA
jgi:hypothetical protein